MKIFLPSRFTYHCSKQTINSPAEKRTIDKKIFAAPSNQVQKNGTIEDMVKDLSLGHEVIPVKFGRIEDDEMIRRRETHWKSQQVIFLDVDHGIEQDTIKAFLQAHPFIP